MTTVVFVHGTGVRMPHAQALYVRVREQLVTCRLGTKVVPCIWGDELGAKLRAGGASVPTYDTTLAAELVVGEDDLERALWSELERDALYEMRLLASAQPQKRGLDLSAVAPGKELERKARALEPAPELRAVLTEAGIAATFGSALREVLDDRGCREALRDAAEPLAPYALALARAGVARASALEEAEGACPPVAANAALRERVVAAVVLAFDEGELSALLRGLTAPLLGVASSLVTWLATRRRRSVTDATFPGAGDILLYQARGAAIRSAIRERVNAAEPPVVLLAHSLGGIACVDLLVGEALPQVALLVTVGSQAPFLYEIGALASLAFGEPLPAHFPAWLNLYDPRDLLSYIAEGVFPGRATDVRIDSRQAFPRSHSAYFDQEATWQAIGVRLP